VIRFLYYAYHRGVSQAVKVSEPILPPPEQWAGLVPAHDSVTYRFAGDGRLFAGAGYALLLQVAHPVVGAGVKDYSDFRSDPWGRLLRTLDFVTVMVFGGPEAAGEMGRRIRAYHRAIRGRLPDGRPYHALEPAAYAWVHATLGEAIVSGHAQYGRSLRPDQTEQFWAEWRALGRLLGVRDRDLPHSWGGFRDYFADMVESTLEPTASVVDVLETLAKPIGPPVRGLRGSAWPVARAPLSHALRLVTIGLMPAVLRDRLGLRWTTAQQLEFRAVCRALRAATPVMPPSLRNTGPAYLRWRRVAIARGDVAGPERQIRAAA
jgi:uncharacterized protein (DUF2236 family)